MLQKNYEQLALKYITKFKIVNSMYIACPNCQTNFIIETSLLLPTGRKVKCSKCMHIWHKEAPEISQITAAVQKKIVRRAIETSYNLPVIIDSQNPPPITAILFPLVLGFIVFFLLIFEHILKNTDTSASKGMSIEVAETQKDLENDVLLVKYKVSNLSHYTKQIPPIKFLFSDDKENIVDFQIIEEKVTLEPHNYIYITSGFQDSSKKIANFDINF